MVAPHFLPFGWLIFGRAVKSQSLNLATCTPKSTSLDVGPPEILLFLLSKLCRNFTKRQSERQRIKRRETAFSVGDALD